MELIDRYVKTVGIYLPPAQKDDITKELSENLRSEMEDKEAELGRPLTSDEQEAVLKQHGHPLVVAGRYRQDQRSLAFGRQWIGPVLFPFYVKVLLFNLGVSFAVVFAVFAASLAAGKSLTFSNVASAFLFQLIVQFGIVTLIFTLLDKHMARFPDRWEPRNVQHLRYPEFFRTGASTGAPRVSRLESISQIIASAVFLVWMRAVQKSPLVIFGPVPAVLRLAPIWHQLYAPWVLLILVAMVQAGINLYRPEWIRFRSAVRVGIDGAALVGIGYLLRAREWVVLANTAANIPDDSRHALEIINHYILYTLVVMGLVVIWLIVRNLWRLVRSPHGQAASRA